MKRHTWFLHIVIGSLIISGCATPGNELPKIDFMNIRKQSPKPAITYSVNSIDAMQQKRPGDFLAPGVDKILRESNLFEIITDETTDKAPYNLALQLEMSSFTPGKEILLAAISGASLGLIPVFVEGNYYLSVNVYKDGKLLKQYYYKDHATTWIHLFLLFNISSHPPYKVVQDVINNMVANFLNDLVQDNLLTGQLTPTK